MLSILILKIIPKPERTIRKIIIGKLRVSNKLSLMRVRDPANITANIF